MSGWAAFWLWVIILALVTYFGLAIVIAIGGFFDVRKMFRRLNELHAARSEDQESAAPGTEGNQAGR